MNFYKISALDPETCISTKVSEIKRITSGVFRKHLSPYNITDSQLNILFIMAKEGEMTQKALSNRISLEKSTLSRNLNRLVDRKLLDSKVFPKLKITTDGMYFVENVIPIWEKAMREIKEKLGTTGEAALDTTYKELTGT